MRRKKKDAQQKAEQQDEPAAASPLETNAVLTAVAGALAGAVARFVVGPLDVLKVRNEPLPPGVPGQHRQAAAGATQVARRRRGHVLKLCPCCARFVACNPDPVSSSAGAHCCGDTAVEVH